MAKAVKSDGKNQELFESFLAGFDEMTKDDRDRAINWFSQPKENGRERMDDIKLPSLVAGMHAFYTASNGRECPAILKKFCFIKLQQGKTSWGKNVKSTPEPDKKFPWNE